MSWYNREPVPTVEHNGITYEIYRNADPAFARAVKIADNRERVKIRSSIGYEGVTYPVTEVSYDCFADNRRITSVYLPDSITQLPSGAFYGCESLASIRLPEKLAEIPYNCFYDCKALKNIQIPGSVTSIVKGAFYGTKLELLNLPASVQEIGNIYDSQEYYWGGAPHIVYRCKQLRFYPFLPNEVLIEYEDPETGERIPYAQAFREDDKAQWDAEKEKRAEKYRKLDNERSPEELEAKTELIRRIANEPEWGAERIFALDKQLDAKEEEFAKYRQDVSNRYGRSREDEIMERRREMGW